MAITTLDGAIAGMRVPENFIKVGGAGEAAGVWHSKFYESGSPGAAAAPTPGVDGAALTSYTGQIPWTNPVSGNSYLARFDANASVACTVLLLDRLWHNSGLSVTSTSSQAISSPTWPARDMNGATSGHGLLAACEWSAAGGAGTPTVTLTYTDQDANTGATATFTGNTTPAAGTFETWPLAAGDTGIRAISAYQASATRTSGTMHLVVYRILARVGCNVANLSYAVDALTSGFPRLYNNTVPFIVIIPTATTAVNVSGAVIVTQG